MLRRIEAGSTSVDVVVLADITNALKKDIDWFVPQRPSLAEQVDYLWQKLQMADTGAKEIETKIMLLMDN